MVSKIIRGWLENRNVLNDTQPSVREFIFAIVLIAGFSLVGITIVDIVIHDNYIIHDIADCHPSNFSERCDALRKANNCEPEDQLCIGKAYFNLLGQMILTGAIFFGIARIILGILAGATINITLFAIGGLWFITAWILPSTGWGDWLYYAIRGLEVPTLLPWLNEVGIFQVFKNLGADPNNVDDTDLYLSMVIGLIVLIKIWLLAIFLHKRK